MANLTISDIQSIQDELTEDEIQFIRDMMGSVGKGLKLSELMLREEFKKVKLIRKAKSGKLE